MGREGGRYCRWARRGGYGVRGRGREGDQGHVEMSRRKTKVSFSFRHEPLKYSCVKRPHVRSQDRHHGQQACVPLSLGCARALSPSLGLALYRSPSLIPLSSSLPLSRPPRTRSHAHVTHSPLADRAKLNKRAKASAQSQSRRTP